MSDLEKVVVREVELPDDKSKFPNLDADKQSENERYVYPFGDGYWRDENTPTGVFLLLGIVFGVGVVAACYGAIRAIWKLFSGENN